MHRAIREGPTRRAKGIEWPLDGILVGVGTLRVLRELFSGRPAVWGSRAWDLSMWCGVTTQGAGRALERLEARGLVWHVDSADPDRAPSWGLQPSHPLYDPLHDLFRAEADVAGAADRERRIAALRAAFRAGAVIRPTTPSPPGG